MVAATVGLMVHFACRRLLGWGHDIQVTKERMKAMTQLVTRLLITNGGSYCWIDGALCLSTVVGLGYTEHTC